MVPRILDIYPSSINLSTQPLPQGNVASPRYKQGDWKAYFETRKNAIMSGSDAALLVHDDSIVDGDTFTPCSPFKAERLRSQTQ